MDLTVVILLIGGLFIASLLAIVIRGEVRRGHPWRDFAEEHGLTYHSSDGERRIEGTRSGRSVCVRALPAGDVQDGEADGAEPRTEMNIAVSLEESSLPLDERGTASSLEHSDEADRLVELQRAEPRLEYSEGRLIYRSDRVITDRRKLGTLVDRMVDSARYIEGRL